MIYPIGAIYMTTTDINPNTLFPSTTWAQIKDTFLLCAGDVYSLGTTGGEATHTLTSDEMPSHTHTFTGSSATTGNVSQGHTHSGPSHSHTVNSHSHSGPSHTHTGPAHGHYPSNGASNGFTTFDVSTDRNGTGVGYTTARTYWAGYSGSTSSAGTGSTGSAGTGSTGGSSPGTSAAGTGATGGISANHTHNVTAKGSNSSTGGGGAHNNMPPYKVINCWERVA